MADWNTPSLNTAYAATLDALKQRDIDAATQFYGGLPVSPVQNMIRLSAENGRWERYNGTAWVEALATYNLGAVSIQQGGLGVGTQSLSFASGGRGNVTIGGAMSAVLGMKVASVDCGFIYHDGSGMLLQNTTSGPLVFGTSNTERARIDAAGNLGIGIYPASWHGSQTAVQVGIGFSLNSSKNNSSSFSLTQGATYDQYGVWRLVWGGITASRYDQVGGEFAWSVAAAGNAGDVASFAQIARLDAGGNLSVTGGVSAATPAANDNSSRLATTSWVAAKGYATLASPALTGEPTAPTPAVSDNSARIATTAFVKAQNYQPALGFIPVQQGSGIGQLGNKIYIGWSGARVKVTIDTTDYGELATLADLAPLAPIASPALTGSPTAPTPAANDNSTRLATTEFVKSQGFVTKDPGAGAIGSYVLAKKVVTDNMTFGQAYPGNWLRPVNANGFDAGAALSGTWRCMGQSTSRPADSTGADMTTLFLRIA